MASKTGKVGFVGGMDIPLIRRFACGYVQGVKHARPDAQVFQNMTGTTPTAWNDPTKGGELARSQFDRGADVVYAAAEIGRATSELQSLMRISYAVFCLKKKKTHIKNNQQTDTQNII